MTTIASHREAQQVLATAVARRIEHMSDEELRALIGRANADLQAENVTLQKRVQQLEQEVAKLQTENERLQYQISRGFFRSEDYDNFDPTTYTIPMAEMLADAEKLLARDGGAGHG